MKASNVTLIFNGQTEAALNFYKSIFGGEFAGFQRMKDMPGAPPMPPEEGEKVMHATLTVGNSAIMAMDMPTGRGTVNPGNNFMIQLDAESEAETRHAFNGLAEGGVVTMPLDHQFWGAYFGMVTDKFGIQWMLNYTEQK